MCKPVVENPPPKAHFWRFVLLVCFFIHLILAIVYLFVSLMNGIFELVIVAILGCATSSMNFCCLTMYMLYMALNSFVFMGYLGLAVQRKNLDDLFTESTGGAKLALILMVLL